MTQWVDKQAPYLREAEARQERSERRERQASTLHRPGPVRYIRRREHSMSIAPPAGDGPKFRRLTR